MKILAVIAGGLGNQVQMTAAVRTLRERLGWEADIFSTGSPWPHETVDAILPGRVLNAGNVTPHLGEYDGAVLLGFGAAGYGGGLWRGLRVLNDTAAQKITCERSEVDISMDACRELGVGENELIWRGEVTFNHDYAGCFDIVLANGYYRKKSGYWDVKGWDGFPALADILRKRRPELTVAAIGADSRERIAGTVDRTGLDILDSLALVARARCLMSTDSFAFHAASPLRTPTAAIFTATSTVKNADGRFHDYATIVGRDDLECRLTCQADDHRWRRCRDRQCREIAPERIADVVEGLLEGR